MLWNSQGIKHQKILWPFLALLVILGLAACRSETAVNPTPTPTPPPTASPGARLYAIYCANCHGSDGGGTQLAPALAGHSVAIIKRQVRSPIGLMPSISPVTLSDANLEILAQYVANMSQMNHFETVPSEEALVMHHWMALMLLKEEDEHALHHLEHIQSLTADPEHRQRIQAVKELVAVGKWHEAEHHLEEMMVTKVEPDLTLAGLHAKLALVALQGGRVVEAREHLEHYLGYFFEAERARVKEALGLLDSGDLRGAEQAIEKLRG